jgi:thiamine-monophosphate kinase
MVASPLRAPRPAQTSEIALLDRIAARVATRAGVAVGIGDDAAVLEGDGSWLVTQDLLVEGVHFRRETTSWRDLGHKALAVNLSDVAAMGGVPVAAVVGLALPWRTRPVPDRALEDLYDGMEALAGRHGVTIAGGDVSEGAVLVLAVTAIGRMEPGRAPVLRSGARPGDVLCVTGALGAAAAGLLTLEDPIVATGLAPEEAEALVLAQRRPEPRVAAGRVLAGVAHAMLDCSDGLALDALRLARASGVAVELDLERVPLAPGVARVAEAAGREPDLLAATGGEDYELIAALAPGRVEAVAAALDVPLTPVGRVTAGEPAIRLLRRGRSVAAPRLGWEHGA